MVVFGFTGAEALVRQQRQCVEKRVIRMNDLTSVAFLIVAALFGFIIVPKFDRDRITDNIEKNGGKVIEIVRVWEWTRHYDRCYDVSYQTARGKRVDATCRTNMWRGVYWVHDRPPGLFSHESVPDDLSADEAERASTPAEPIQCLDCGASIPADKMSCPQCGWSYRAHAESNLK